MVEALLITTAEKLGHPYTSEGSIPRTVPRYAGKKNDFNQQKPKERREQANEEWTRSKKCATLRQAEIVT